MATIQPVYGPDYQKLLLQGLQTYSGIKQLQRQDSQEERLFQKQKQSDLKAQQQTEVDAQIKDLSARALTDPQAMAQLQLVAPDKWNEFQKAKQFQREETEFQQKQDLVYKALYLLIVIQGMQAILSLQTL